MFPLCIFCINFLHFGDGGRTVLIAIRVMLHCERPVPFFKLGERFDFCEVLHLLMAGTLPGIL